MNYNAEGYADPTAGEAWSNIQKEERAKEAERLAAVSALVANFKQTAANSGFDIVGRIPFRDRKTGKEYR